MQDDWQLTDWRRSKMAYTVLAIFSPSPAISTTRSVDIGQHSLNTFITAPVDWSQHNHIRQVNITQLCWLTHSLNAQQEPVKRLQWLTQHVTVYNRNKKMITLPLQHGKLRCQRHALGMMMTTAWTDSLFSVNGRRQTAGCYVLDTELLHGSSLVYQLLLFFLYVCCHSQFHIMSIIHTAP